VIVLFDLDGTVWDSEAGIVGCMEHAFAALGLPVPPREVLASNVGPPLREMLVEAGVPEERADDAVLHYRERYLEWGAYQAELYPGMAELIEALARSGHRLATATSKAEGPTHVMLEHFGLRGHFEAVGAASMDGTATTKTRVIDRALDGLGRPDPGECVMVGDRHYDVLGAAAHGIDCIGVAWGYSSGTELVDAGARSVAHDVDQLRAELLAP